MAANTIYQKRDKLSAEIAALLHKFTKETGHVVTGIEFQRIGWPIGGKKENLIQYDVKVNVERARTLTRKAS